MYKHRLAIKLGIHEDTKMKRRYQRKSEVAPVLETKAEAAPVAKVKKSRKPRLHRIFTYRGVPFFLSPSKQNADHTIISIMNKETNTPEPQLTVPRSEAIKAAQSLAKIVLTEEYLSGLEVNKDVDA